MEEHSTLVSPVMGSDRCQEYINDQLELLDQMKNWIVSDWSKQCIHKGSYISSKF